MPRSNEVSDERKDNIVLRLFFNNPIAIDSDGEDEIFERVFSFDELFASGYADFECRLTSIATVFVKFINGLLHIKTSKEVDVFISQATPVKALHIETKGWVALIDDHRQTFPIGCFINAKGVKLKAPITTPFVQLLTDHHTKNAVQIAKPLHADKLSVNTMDLVLDAEVYSKQADLRFTTCSVLTKGDLRLLTIPRHKQSLDPRAADNTPPDVEDTATHEFSSAHSSDSGSDSDELSQHPFLKFHEAEIKKLNDLEKSRVYGDKLFIRGQVRLFNTTLRMKQSVIFEQNSLGQLEKIGLEAH